MIISISDSSPVCLKPRRLALKKKKNNIKSADR